MAVDPGHDLTDRVTLITGAGSGIGRGIAQRLAAFGAQVVVADVNEAAGAETVRLVESDEGTAFFVKTDVTVKADAEGMVAAALERFGRVDHLVNNAGLITLTPFLELPEEEWDLVMDVNLKGQFLCAQAFARALVDAGHGGAIVNLGSVESEVVAASGEHCQPHYNASKGGVKMLTKALAFELARYGIRVNGVNPASIDTRFAGDLHQSPRAIEYTMRRNLLKRIGQPLDVARAVHFLLSDNAAFVTGTMLAVDAGWLVQ
ncbi:MAG: SDR family oxidoreductase [Chloroflexi bacterium]|nr:SDR family oxidoreductase [Chloroflexota bacterium]